MSQLPRSRQSALPTCERGRTGWSHQDTFESKYGGRDADNLDLWKAFYHRNASFYTICANCREFTPSAEEVKQRVARGVDVSSSDSDDDDGPRFSKPVQLPSKASGVMVG